MVTVFGKTFYLRTFGCQMNVPIPKRSSATLMARGYTQVETPERRPARSLQHVQHRDKAEQKVFNRCSSSSAPAGSGKILRRAGLRGPAGRREDLFRPRPDGAASRAPPATPRLAEMLAEIESVTAASPA